MKKLNKVAMLFASAALAVPVASFAAAHTGGAMPKSIDNWRATDGTVWKNGTNEYCWRDGFWTPATAKVECDGALKKAPPPAPVVPAPAPATAAPAAPRPAPALEIQTHCSQR